MNKKPTKVQLICYLIAKNGPMTRQALLEECARVEGKEYKPNSNKSYFTPSMMAGRRSPSAGWPPYPPDVVEKMDRNSIVAAGYVEPVGKIGNKIVYGLTAKGGLKAAEYIELTKTA